MPFIITSDMTQNVIGIISFNFWLMQVPTWARNLAILYTKPSRDVIKSVKVCGIQRFKDPWWCSYSMNISCYIVPDDMILSCQSLITHWLRGPVWVCCRESGMKQNAYYIEITSMHALGVEKHRPSANICWHLANVLFFQTSKALNIHSLSVTGIWFLLHC